MSLLLIRNIMDFRFQQVILIPGLIVFRRLQDK